jgi:hypothetical protein
MVSPICVVTTSNDERIQHDRISDIACFSGPARDRAVGDDVISADIIPFIPRRSRKRGLADFSASVSPPDDLVMDHADMAPCEYVWSDEGDPESTENIDA